MEELDKTEDSSESEEEESSKVGEDFILDEGDLTNIIDVDNTSEGEDESTIIHQEEDRGGTEPGEQTEASLTEEQTEASMTEEHEPRQSTRERRMPIRWIQESETFGNVDTSTSNEEA